MPHNHLVKPGGREEVIWGERREKVIKEGVIREEKML